MSGLGSIAKTAKSAVKNKISSVKSNVKSAASNALGDFTNNLKEEILNDIGVSTHKTLKKFLNEVSYAHNNGIAIKQPDPLNSFDIRFKFFPCKLPLPPKNKKITGEDITDSIGNAVGRATEKTITNTINTATSGLLGSLINNNDIQKEHDNFQNAGEQTFLEYLAKANLITEIDQVMSPLELNMTYFIQSMTIPQLHFETESDDVQYLGKFPINGRFVEPDNHTLTMTVMNTRIPILERLFYPWMKEVTLPFWSYPTQPYTTANIIVDFSSHADVKYIFIGCRPSNIETYQPTQAAPSGMTRQIQFIFDYMFVHSEFHTTDEWYSKLLGTSPSFIKLG